MTLLEKARQRSQTKEPPKASAELAELVLEALAGRISLLAAGRVIGCKYSANSAAGMFAALQECQRAGFIVITRKKA
jgi:hypothetical protein